MMEYRCDGGGGGWWVFGREGKGDAVAFDRDPKLNCEDGGNRTKGEGGSGNNHHL